jgi:hypothetical protein
VPFVGNPQSVWWLQVMLFWAVAVPKFPKDSDGDFKQLGPCVVKPTVLGRCLVNTKK